MRAKSETYEESKVKAVEKVEHATTEANEYKQKLETLEARIAKIEAKGEKVPLSILVKKGQVHGATHTVGTQRYTTEVHNRGTYRYTWSIFQEIHACVCQSSHVNSALLCIARDDR